MGGSLTFGSHSVIGVPISCKRIKLWRVQATIISHCYSNLIWVIMSTKIFHLPFNTPKVLSTVTRSDEWRWLNRSLTPFAGPFFWTIEHYGEFASLYMEPNIQQYLNMPSLPNIIFLKVDTKWLQVAPIYEIIIFNNFTNTFTVTCT